jgi:hypothetical protein
MDTNNDKDMENIINTLFKIQTNNYIFIYTPPKVGSTTLVTSLRVSLNKSYNIIHIHDEVMLNVLTGVNNVKINDIIHFLSNQGKKIYVIDVYRTPIERKMSEFFEKLASYHFNNSPENIRQYDIKRIINRFNKIFPYLENGDHYFDKYQIENPVDFDFSNKFTIQEVNNVKYIKLRLCDANLWSNILSNIFKSDIIIIHDYLTENKNIGELYKKFKENYKLPINYYELIKNNKYLNFYYNNEEKNKYLNMWENKTTVFFQPYTLNEYNFYIQLCLENQSIADVDYNHYIDNGCFCKLCTLKRKNIYFKAKKGETIFEKIIHENSIKKEKYFTAKFEPNQFAIKLL